MRTGPTQQTTWAARVVRGLWPDHNPVRRPSDRLEAGLVAALIVAFLAGAPLVALLACRLALGVTVTTQAARHEGWRQVPAVLLADAPTSGYGAASVRATWTAPDGARCRGMVYPTPGARAGTTTPIWVTASGRQVAWPMTPFQATSQAYVVAAIAVPAWAMLLCGAGLAGRRAIDARRMAAWDAELRAANLTGPAGAGP